MDTFYYEFSIKKYPWIFSCFLISSHNCVILTFVFGFCLGYGEESVVKLSEHFHQILERILNGSWTHLPPKVNLEKKLQDRKRFRKADVDPAIREYDIAAKSLWPTLASISRTINELKDKVCFVA